MSGRRLLLVLGIIGVIVLAPLAYWGLWHGRIPMMDGAMPHMSGGAPLAEVRMPALTPAAEQGQALFEANCAACHGQNAAGRDGAGPPLVHIIYEPNHHGDAAFQLAAAQGVRAHHWRFGDMPPMDGVTPEDVDKITAYVRELQRANGIF